MSDMLRGLKGGVFGRVVSHEPNCTANGASFR
jgi:hypothetical protein